MRRCVWMLMALVAVTSTVKAQEQTNSLPITLEKAIEIGLSDNPTILIADQEIRRMEYAKQESKGNLLPNVSGSGSFTHNIKKQKMYMGGGGGGGLDLSEMLPEGFEGLGDLFGGGPIEMGLKNSVNAGVNLTMPLFMPSIYKMIQLSEQQIRSAVESARQNKITLANQIKKSYYGILLAESSLDVLLNNIDLAQQIVNDTQNSFNQGVVSEYDLITAEVQLSNLQPTLIQTENSIRIARLTLNMLLSIPLNTSLEMSETLYDFKDYLNTEYNGHVDLSENSDLKLLEIQQDMLDKQLGLQKAQRMPTLSGFLNYQVSTQSESMGLAHYRWFGSSATGLQMNIPIFAGYTNKRKESQIKVNMNQLKLQREYTEQALDVEAQTALSNIEKAKKQMIANEATKNQAEKGYRISKTRYDVGAGTIVELNSAQMALLQADLNYSQSIFDFMSAQADYDKVIGKEN